MRRRYPASPEELQASPLLAAWWYYTVELLPGVVARGIYADTLPMLPRGLLRRCRPESQDCLDIGTMEGLVPILLARRGARSVLAVDYIDHCVGKLAAVQHYYGVSFDYRSVRPMHSVGERLRRHSFDLVNLSGLLYHVYSPLALLASVRQLLKRNGILIVSPYVTLDPAATMDFNVGGRMWAEGNTFWFPSVALLDYILRYLRLVPIDCAFMPDSEVHDAAPGRNAHIDFGKETGYLSVACRAVDAVEEDEWMRESARSSWEFRDATDWALVRGRPESSIAYDALESPHGIDLHSAVRDRQAVRGPAGPDDGHVLTLSATS